MKEYEVIIPIRESWVFRVLAKNKKRAIYIAQHNTENVNSGESVDQICSSNEKRISVREIKEGFHF